MIIIPMAGMSRRFLEQGYEKPKFMLPLWDGYVFDYAASSFSANFSDKEMMFIIRETGGVRDFLEQRIRALGIEKPLFCVLEHPTAGQAETVEIGLDHAEIAPEVPITVFNIDTFRMPHTIPQGLPQNVAGWLEVFKGEGDNWSFVKPSGENGLAAATAEKIPISDLCCTGLYHFASSAIFRDALEIERANPSSKELYIAPIYNHLLSRGDRIGYGVIEPEQVVFCGVPDEYENLLKRPAPYPLSASAKVGEEQER